MKATTIFGIIEESHDIQTTTKRGTNFSLFNLNFPM